MKPVAVTIGIGKYLNYAEKSSEYVRNHLGLETRIITDEHIGLGIDALDFTRKVFSIKFSIFDIFPDIERVMYHDCDWRPVRQFDLMPFIPDPKGLYFCVDRVETEHIQDLERKYGLPPKTYCNAGWFVADREQHQMLQHSKKHYFDYPKQWDDQCVLNQVNKDKITIADKRLNVMDLNGQFPLKEVLALHTSGNYPIYDGQPDHDWES